LAREIRDVAIAAPWFLAAPTYRRWHLRWGASDEEVAELMPGDEFVPKSHFTATRAITIEAPPAAVWPWLVQVGFGRAGFYSYDLLDSLGRPSADKVLEQWQDVAAGDLAAPMTGRPTADTSFRVAQFKVPEYLVWTKPDSSWAWRLTPLPGGRTRLVTRLKQRYRLVPATIVTVLLLEFGDFPMMRKMLRGLKQRAERRAGRPVRPIEDTARSSTVS
jgi:hypothetical protein